MFCRYRGCSIPIAVYTSLKRCRQLARSSSRLTYSTFPCAQSHFGHFFPSAIATHNSICKKDFPAFDGPAISILCPFLRMPSIRHGERSGRLSHTSPRPSGSGRSSLIPSIHSYHSFQDAFPMLVSTRNCFFPFRITPGILESLEGFRFCVSTTIPFFWQTS